MRVVGGPNDGEDHKVDNPVIVLQWQDLQRVEDFDPDKPGVNKITVTVTTYTVRTIRCNDEDLQFLAPEEWGDLQALRHLFERKARFENTLRHIAFMDVYTPAGEKMPHEVMRDLAEEALKP